MPQKKQKYRNLKEIKEYKKKEEARNKANPMRRDIYPELKH